MANQQNRFPEFITPRTLPLASFSLSTVYPWVKGEYCFASDALQLMLGNDNTTGGSFLPVATGEATLSLTNQGASITTTNIITPPVNGLYRINYYVEVTTSSAAGTLALAFGWTDENGAQTLTSVSGMVVTSTGYNQGQVVMRAKTTGAITYAVTLAGVVGSPKYALYCMLERLF